MLVSLHCKYKCVHMVSPLHCKCRAFSKSMRIQASEILSEKLHIHSTHFYVYVKIWSACLSMSSQHTSAKVCETHA